jgi:hypothetical protein
MPLTFVCDLISIYRNSDNFQSHVLLVRIKARPTVRELLAIIPVWSTRSQLFSTRRFISVTARARHCHYTQTHVLFALFTHEPNNFRFERCCWRPSSSRRSTVPLKGQSSPVSITVACTCQATTHTNPWLTLCFSCVRRRSRYGGSQLCIV